MLKNLYARPVLWRLSAEDLVGLVEVRFPLSRVLNLSPQQAPVLDREADRSVGRYWARMCPATGSTKSPDES